MHWLVVIDMQQDFVTGALGTKEAQAVVEGVAARIRTAIQNGDRVFVTLDTHQQDYMQTQEGRHLPVPHCIEGTEGWRLCPEISAALHEAAPGQVTTVRKPTFGAAALPALMRQQAACDGMPEGIEFVGVCTSICVVSNALLVKANFVETPVTVDAACCACVSPQSHDAALQVMQTCQIDVRNAGAEPWRA